MHCSTVKSRLAGWLFPRRKCGEESHSCMAIKSCLVGLPLRQEASWLQSSGGVCEGEEEEISRSTQHWCDHLCRNFPVASVLKTASSEEPAQCRRMKLKTRGGAGKRTVDYILIQEKDERWESVKEALGQSLWKTPASTLWVSGTGRIFFMLWSEFYVGEL